MTLAGASEPAARIVQAVAVDEGGSGTCVILGTPLRASASHAALANGTAAHALDYDDMCFVSLAHPSAPLVAAALAAAEVTGASGAALLDGYVVGFEIEGRLGRVMNPRALRARMALHLDDRNRWRGGGGARVCSASTPQRPLTRSRSRRRKRRA